MRNFYQRREWQSLRYRVLVKYGRKCMMCNASAQGFGTTRSHKRELNWSTKVSGYTGRKKRLRGQ